MKAGDLEAALGQGVYHSNRKVRTQTKFLRHLIHLNNFTFPSVQEPASGVWLTKLEVFILSIILKGRISFCWHLSCENLGLPEPWANSDMVDCA